MKTFLFLALVTFVLAAAGFIGIRSLRAEPANTKAAAEAATASVIIPVKGMSCMACVAKTKRTLSAVPGVTHVDVKLSPGSATVKYNRAQATPDKIASAITGLGYQAGEPVPKAAQ